MGVPAQVSQKVFELISSVDVWKDFGEDVLAFQLFESLVRFIIHRHYYNSHVDH